MPHSPLALITLALIVVIAMAGLIVGDWRMRTGVLNLIGSSLGGSVIYSLWPDSGSWALRGIDGLCLLVFISLCWKSAHPWPIWASACQGVGLMCTLLNDDVGRWAYLSVQYISGYGTALALSAGIFTAARHKWGRHANK